MTKENSQEMDQKFIVKKFVFSKYESFKGLNFHKKFPKDRIPKNVSKRQNFKKNFQNNEKENKRNFCKVDI